MHAGWSCLSRKKKKTEGSRCIGTVSLIFCWRCGSFCQLFCCCAEDSAGRAYFCWACNSYCHRAQILRAFFFSSAGLGWTQAHLASMSSPHIKAASTMSASRVFSKPVFSCCLLEAPTHVTSTRVQLASPPIHQYQAHTFLKPNASWSPAHVYLKHICTIPH